MRKAMRYPYISVHSIDRQRIPRCGRSGEQGAVVGLFSSRLLVYRLPSLLKSHSTVFLLSPTFLPCRLFLLSIYLATVKLLVRHIRSFVRSSYF